MKLGRYVMNISRTKEIHEGVERRDLRKDTHTAFNASSTHRAHHGPSDGSPQLCMLPAVLCVSHAFFCGWPHAALPPRAAVWLSRGVGAGAPPPRLPPRAPPQATRSGTANLPCRWGGAESPHAPPPPWDHGVGDFDHSPRVLCVALVRFVALVRTLATLCESSISSSSPSSLSGEEDVVDQALRAVLATDLASSSLPTVHAPPALVQSSVAAAGAALSPAFARAGLLPLPRRAPKSPRDTQAKPDPRSEIARCTRQRGCTHRSCSGCCCLRPCACQLHATHPLPSRSLAPPSRAAAASFRAPLPLPSSPSRAPLPLSSSSPPDSSSHTPGRFLSCTPCRALGTPTQPSGPPWDPHNQPMKRRLHPHPHPRPRCCLRRLMETAGAKGRRSRRGRPTSAR
ncbi:hypothetical protein BV25DRAFT_716848 [Artomyces pyxidatus]|uniref:Uncharacterized protein n=1 Tax=Artomyces pyxidatus TaxID=48021 RepID=A0ACB8T0F0_9AGAM|nr:hypothetical protein BV25DRAFT_716848 [Artomyces pyxidatus]